MTLLSSMSNVKNIFFFIKKFFEWPGLAPEKLGLKDLTSFSEKYLSLHFIPIGPVGVTFKQLTFITLNSFETYIL